MPFRSLIFVWKHLKINNSIVFKRLRFGPLWICLDKCMNSKKCLVIDSITNYKFLLVERTRVFVQFNKSNWKFSTPIKLQIWKRDATISTKIFSQFFFYYNLSQCRKRLDTHKELLIHIWKSTSSFQKEI